MLHLCRCFVPFRIGFFGAWSGRVAMSDALRLTVELFVLRLVAPWKRGKRLSYFCSRWVFLGNHVFRKIEVLHNIHFYKYSKQQGINQNWNMYINWTDHQKTSYLIYDSTYGIYMQFTITYYSKWKVEGTVTFLVVYMGPLVTYLLVSASHLFWRGKAHVATPPCPNVLPKQPHLANRIDNW